MVLPSQPKSSVLRTLAAVLVCLGVAVFVLRGYHDEQHVLEFRDFKQPYSSARCLLHGCNPYSESATHEEFLRAGGTDDDAQVFRPFSALYPPFSLAVLTPVAALSYPAAHRLWFALIAVLVSLAVLAVLDLCRSADFYRGADLRRGAGLDRDFTSAGPTILLSLFIASSTILLMLGQISGPVIALLVIGFWCLLRGRVIWLAILCFTVALCLKPHDAALLVCYLPFAGRSWRRAFVAIAALTAVIVVAGTLWCAATPASAGWLTDLRANLHGNAAPGGADDPSLRSTEALYMANLQPLFSTVTPSHALSNVLALGTVLLLLAVWLPPAIRLPNTLPKHLLAIGSLACLTLLPIYHRQYDTRLLLLAFPAVSFLLSQRRSWGSVWGLLSFAALATATVLTSHQYLQKFAGRFLPSIATAAPLKILLLLRPLPLSELALAVALLAAFHAFERSMLLPEAASSLRPETPTISSAARLN